VFSDGRMTGKRGRSKLMCTIKSSRKKNQTGGQGKKAGKDQDWTIFFRILVGVTQVVERAKNRKEMGGNRSGWYH